MPGPFHFAWVDVFETAFDPVVHSREDEDVFSFMLSQSEGDFATLEVEIRNPRVGLLSAGRRQWAWLSWHNGTETVPLFFGRLVGIPDDIHLEIVRLIFTGRPADYGVQKDALAASLRVAPYWDPVFITEDRRTDPDVVLEARTSLWHIDRVTHELTTSDILVGEDGIEEFLASEVPYDSVSVRLQQPPLRSVSVEALVQWDQNDSGNIGVYQSATFTSFCISSLKDDWPKAGSGLGGGWSVDSSSARTDLDLIPDNAFHSEQQLTAPPPPLDDDVETVEPVPEPPRSTQGLPIPPNWLTVITEFKQSGVSGTNKRAVADTQISGFIVPEGTMNASLRLAYETSRKRADRLRFTLNADLQPILTMPGEDEVLSISVGGNVGEPLDPQASQPDIPIGDVRRRSYFPTERGLQSIQYLIALARAHLLLRSRAVEVTFEVPFERAIQLTCRKNALVHDDRLPGRQALGKITGYSFRADGDSGTLIGSVTIGCAIGYGGAIAEIPGDPTYVDDGYVEDGYEFREGQLVALPASDVGYVVPEDAPQDDGLVFPLKRVPWVVPPHFIPLDLTPGVIQPWAPGSEPAAIEAGVKAQLAKQLPTIGFTMKPVTGGPFESPYDLQVSDLVVPAMINLEAAS